MKTIELFNKDSIAINADASSRDECIDKAVEIMLSAGFINDAEKYKKGIYEREKLGTTGVGNYVAIPHCQSDCVVKAGIVFMKLNDGVDWNSFDDTPAKLIFMIAAPNSKDNVHLSMLAKLSAMLVHEELIDALLKVETQDEFLSILDNYEKNGSLESKSELDVGNVNDDSSNKNNNVENLVSSSDNDSKSNEDTLILAVTSCPTGVAHTYMAKEELEKAGEKLGINIKVETNGSGGAKNVLTKEEIERAKTIIVAADAFVEMSRFNGKPLIECPVSNAIKDAEKLLNQACSDNIPIYKNNSSDMFQVAEGSGKGHTIYKHLMSGISHMIPFVVAGGILLAIAYLIDGICGSPKDGAVIDGISYSFGSINLVARIFRDLGATFGLGLMLPILGGFISYSIAGKPGLVSGFVGSFAATKGTFSVLYYINLATTGVNGEFTLKLANSSSGFIGAIAAGFISGYFVKMLLNKWENWDIKLQGIKDMLIIPFVSTLFVGACMFVLNVPFGLLNIGLGIGLTALKDAGFILLLGALVAGLMAIDMGGPINKANHYFVLGLVTAALEPGSSPDMQTLAYQLMASNLLGMMTPPVGIAIATWVFPQKFTFAERAPSLANCFIGCCGITESAIPYVAANPAVFLISCITGASVGGLVCVLLGMEAIAPEGGTISFIVMGASCWKGILATFIGSVVTAVLIGLLRRDAPADQARLSSWKGIPIGRR